MNTTTHMLTIENALRTVMGGDPTPSGRSAEMGDLMEALRVTVADPQAHPRVGLYALRLLLGAVQRDMTAERAIAKAQGLV